MPSISVDPPDRYLGSTFDRYDPAVSPTAAAALAASRALVAAEADRMAGALDTSPRCVVLVGPPGVGKTHLAAATTMGVQDAAISTNERAEVGFAEAERDHEAACRARSVREHELFTMGLSGPLSDEERAEAADLRQYRPGPRRPRPLPMPVWVNVPGVLVDIRREFGSDERPVHDQLDSLRKHRTLVVLDDLGREKATDWTAEVLYVLVNDRYEAMLPTFVTTNLTRAELVTSGYWPVISRLAEDGLLVEIKAPDQRLRKGAR